ncbi:MAG: hypothetical protein AAB428_01850 [Patescibacteria group bacterium]
MITLIGCQPEIVIVNGLEVTVPLKDGEEVKKFLEAVSEARKTPAERYQEYGLIHGCFGQPISE